MIRSNGERGVALMILILVIAVFAGIAVAIVTLLRARHESYPYQVQSYQAYTLASAGIEFAIRYAKDNADPSNPNNFFNHPDLYIPPGGKVVKFGNGQFVLRYVQGCPDMLYSRGEYGVAVREVRLTNFSHFVGQNTGPLYGMPGTLRPIGPNRFGPYKYDSIQFGLCDTSLLQGTSTQSKIVKDSLTIAATKDAYGHPVKLWRLGLQVTFNATYRWVWDATCETSNVTGGYYNPWVIPPWDGTSNPPNASFTPSAWNVNNSLDPSLDGDCRPQLVTDLFDSTQPNYTNRPQPEASYPNFDNTATCPVSDPNPHNIARSHTTCRYTSPPVEPWTTPPLGGTPPFPVPIVDATIDYGSAVGSNPSARFIIETSDDIQPPVTFYVSFLHRPWDPALGGPGSPQPFAFQFTLH